MRSLGRKLKNLKISKSTRAVETSLDFVANVAADAEQNTSSDSFYTELWDTLSESAAQPFSPARWSLEIPVELLQAILEEHLATDNVTLRALEQCCRCLRELVRAVKYRGVRISSHSEAGSFSPVGLARILSAFPEVGKCVRSVRASSGELFGGPLGVDDAQRRCDAWTFIFERMRVSFVGLRALEIEFRGIFWAAGSMDGGIMRAIWGVLKMGVVGSLSLVGGTWPVSVFGIAARDMEKIRFAPRRVIGPAQAFKCVPVGARELCRPVITEFDLADVDAREIEMLLGASGWLGFDRTVEMDLGIPWVHLSALNGVWPACRALRVLRIKPRWRHAPGSRVASAVVVPDDNAEAVDLTPLVSLRRLVIHWDTALHRLDRLTAPRIYGPFVINCLSYLPLGVDEVWLNLSQVSGGAMDSFPWKTLERIALSRQQFKLTFVVLDDGFEPFIQDRMSLLAAEQRVQVYVRGGSPSRGGGST